MPNALHLAGETLRLGEGAGLPALDDLNVALNPDGREATVFAESIDTIAWANFLKLRPMPQLDAAGRYTGIINFHGSLNGVTWFLRHHPGSFFKPTPVDWTSAVQATTALPAIRKVAA
jgi:hypothetical protein